jgi:hypothetical protein
MFAKDTGLEPWELDWKRSSRFADVVGLRCAIIV